MKKTIYAALALVTGIAVTSCRNDFDFDEAHNLYSETVKSYNASFKDLYGDIDPEQEWDFSTGGKVSVTRQATTPTIYVDTDTSHKKTFSSDFRNAVSKVLPENDWQLGKFEPFVLIYDGPFNIYPIWEGRANYWNLYAQGADGVIKYADIVTPMGGSASSTGPIDIKDEDMTVNGFRIEGFKIGEPVVLYLQVVKQDNDGYVKIGDKIPTVFNPALKIEVTKNSTYAKAANYKVGDYVEKTNGALKLPLDHAAFTTTEAAKKYYDKIKASGELKELQDEGGYLIMFEDANQYNTDMDFNDVIFYTTAPTAIYTDYTFTPTTTNIEKRYMFEDLGATSTSDIDFNDIVVDLTDNTTTWKKYEVITIGKVTETKEIKYEDWTDEEKSKYQAQHKQTATIRAMGGKLDFELQIGSTTIFKKSRDYKDVTFMDNTGFLEGDGNGKGDKNNIDPNKVIFYKEFTTEFPWDYSTNNVWAVISNGASGSVDDKKVTELDGNSGQYVIKFPEKGDVPQMIAFDTTKEWYPERVSIKSRSNSWWGK